MRGVGSGPALVMGQVKIPKKCNDPSPLVHQRRASGRWQHRFGIPRHEWLNTWSVIQ